jgi:zinc protease
MVVPLVNRGLFLGRTLAWTEKLNAAIDALTPDDVAAVLKKGHIDPGRVVKITAGDLKKAAATP